MQARGRERECKSAKELFGIQDSGGVVHRAPLHPVLSLFTFQTMSVSVSWPVG